MQPSSTIPGNIKAEALVRDNIGWMINVAQRVLGDRSLAEDAVQNAFISAHNVKIRLHRARAALKKLIEPILRGEAPS